MIQERLRKAKKHAEVERYEAALNKLLEQRTDDPDPGEPALIMKRVFGRADELKKGRSAILAKYFGRIVVSDDIVDPILDGVKRYAVKDVVAEAVCAKNPFRLGDDDGSQRFLDDLCAVHFDRPAIAIMLGISNQALRVRIHRLKRALSDRGYRVDRGRHSKSSHKPPLCGALMNSVYNGEGIHG